MIEEFLRGGGGDECGAPNPLQSLTRNIEGDRFSSFLQERWVPTTTTTNPDFDFQRPLCNDAEIHDALHTFIGSTVNGAPLVLPESIGTLAPEDRAAFIERSAMLARQIAPDPQVGASNVASLASTFHVSPEQQQQQPNVTGPALLDDGWSVGAEHLDAFEKAWGQQQPQQQQQSSWASEFLGPQAMQHNAQPTDFEAAWQQGSIGDQDKALEDAWAQSTTTTSTTDVGVPLDTTPAESAAVMATAKHILATMGSEPLIQNTEFMKFIRKLSTGELRVEGNSVVEGPPSEGDISATIGPLSAAERAGFGEDPRVAAESWADEFERFEDGAIPERAFALGGEYAFTAPAGNPYIGHVRAFAKGQELLAAGRTADATLAFEAEIAQRPENADAWRMLGMAQADGDNDQQAIAALTAAHSLDPANLGTLMALAVSLCNDLHRERSVNVLAEWIRANPRYAALPVPPLEQVRPQDMPRDGFEGMEAGVENFEGFEEMVESYSRCMQTLTLFNEALATPGGRADPDVQIGLGLLYNLTYDYDQAAEMFGAALAQRPEDSMLWNKLGATLANSNRNEEAIDAYRHALQIRPGYIRAHSNLAISLINADQPLEAAKEFLRALELDPSADHIWENLRIAFSMMHREDLAEKTELRDPDFFRSDLDF